MTDTDTIEVLQRVDLFHALSRSDLEAIASIAKDVQHRSGERILDQGEEGIGFHLIIEGTAEVEVNGRRVGEYGPGDYFGEISLLDGKPRSATVTASSNLRTMSIPAWNFDALMDRHPEMTKAVLRELCARIRKAESNKY